MLKREAFFIMTQMEKHLQEPILINLEILLFKKEIGIV